MCDWEGEKRRGGDFSCAAKVGAAISSAPAREANFLSTVEKPQSGGEDANNLHVKFLQKKTVLFNFFALLQCKIFDLSFPVGIVVIMFQATFKYYLLEVRTALLRGLIQLTSTVTVFMQAACLVSSSF